jgi:hypothetical protein
MPRLRRCEYFHRTLAGQSAFADDDVVASHFGSGILDLMTPAERAETMVIVSARDPIQRMSSGYYYLRDK